MSLTQVGRENMTTQESKQKWRHLQAEWIASTARADTLERELIASLRLCSESKAQMPTALVIDAFERARGKALSCRVQVLLFVDKLFLSA
jgi:hypothetical protein